MLTIREFVRHVRRMQAIVGNPFAVPPPRVVLPQARWMCLVANGAADGVAFDMPGGLVRIQDANVRGFGLPPAMWQLVGLAIAKSSFNRSQFQE